MDAASSVALIEGIVLLVVGWLVSRLRVGECERCPHCRAERQAEERRREMEHEREHPRRAAGCWRCVERDKRQLDE